MGKKVHFDGDTYDADRDRDRLLRQLIRVTAAMKDGAWHTLSELEVLTGAPMQSASARLRDLRKKKFGRHVVIKRYISRGLWEYLLDPTYEVILAEEQRKQAQKKRRGADGASGR